MSTSEVSGQKYPQEPHTSTTSSTSRVLPEENGPISSRVHENPATPAEITSVRSEDIELPEASLIEYYKNTTDHMREHVKTQIANNAPIAELNEFISMNYTSLMSSAAKFAEKQLEKEGKYRPVDYAIGGLGSLARGDVSPYSDLDFILIVKSDEEGTRTYFEELLGVMRELIVGLGETKPMGGIQFCSDGMNPPYQKREQTKKTIGGTPQFYGTAEQLAQNALRTERSREITVPAASTGAVQIALQQVSLIHGSNSVFQGFIQERSKLYAETSPDNPKETIRQQKGLQFMQSSFSRMTELGELQGTLAKDTGYIDVKSLVLRPITATVGGLCIYYDIEETNTLRGIDQLIQKKALNKTMGEKLKETYALGNRLRYQAQLVAKAEDDKVSIGETGVKYNITTQEKKQLLECQRVLFALRNASAEFVAKRGNSKAFI